jgi:hypothetical protein
MVCAPGAARSAGMAWASVLGERSGAEAEGEVGGYVWGPRRRGGSPGEGEVDMAGEELGLGWATA